MPGRRRCIAVAIAVLALAACSGGASATGGDGGSTSIPGVVIERAAGRNHRQGQIDYPGKKPPSGGDHNPIWLTCGAYSQQPPDEYAVHSLEHGAVWIAYGPSVAAADVATLRALAKRPKLLVTPYAGLDAPIVMVAWEHRLELQSANDPRIQQFIDAYGNGQVAPEGASSCTGGVGVPDPL